jgi:tripartite-type tricarboxylate transporter receptor subunit TctC
MPSAKQAMRPTMLAFIAAVVVSGAPTVGSANDFYAGKTVKLYIGFGPGGSYDVYGRLLSRHLKRFIPGNPNVVPENMPGVGGLLVANYMAGAAPKDGLSLAMISEGGAIEQALENPAVRFDAAKFRWIGLMTGSVTLFFTWHTSPTKSFEDLRRRSTPFGSTGAGNTDFLPKMMNKLAGAQFRVIAGYKGSTDVMLAVERGEVEGGFGLYTDLRERKAEWLRDRVINPIVFVAPKRYSELPDVPIISEVGLTPEDGQVLALLNDGQLGRSIFTSPDVSAERVSILRKAFSATMQDPEFLQEAKKARLEIDPRSGDEMQALVERVIATPKALARRAADARK